MASIEEKRLALDMAEKIIKQRQVCQNSTHLKDNSQSGFVSYWKELYLECLKVIKESD
ncbi:MAG: hypothetical protein Q4F77_00445 [Acinetobacter sp.]|uniref:hypothetical protein n=1 Tax=Acinetobacter sp. TaxID=472 RepID=UPI0026DFC4CB|nr:hypothetical protein [Acinetobacter sp.]MDO5541752.1 hypothetical protein [Acinetobacter sp.]